ncbi:hypothetical protein [Desulfovibrio inopinatus]|uniref:hypothetical protein n=1 Tax=Desulfovibrio inopinatus TaxID=102109 RepID=UPI000421D561|nr:hypothetical protein [Desulfovibrio inopinatus]
MDAQVSEKAKEFADKKVRQELASRNLDYSDLQARDYSALTELLKRTKEALNVGDQHIIVRITKENLPSLDSDLVLQVSIKSYLLEGMKDVVMALRAKKEDDCDHDLSEQVGSALIDVLDKESRSSKEIDVVADVEKRKVTLDFLRSMLERESMASIAVFMTMPLALFALIYFTAQNVIGPEVFTSFISSIAGYIFGSSKKI